MRHLTKKILALSPMLALLIESFVGHFRREYQLPDDHTHSEDLKPALGIQTAAPEIAQPPVPFVPDDDSQIYGQFFLAQHQRTAPPLSYMMASE